MGRGTSAGTPEQRTVGTVSTLVKRQVSAVERQISTASTASAPVTEQFSKAGTLLRQILNDLIVAVSTFKLLLIFGSGLFWF